MFFAPAAALLDRQRPYLAFIPRWNQAITIIIIIIIIIIITITITIKKIIIKTIIIMLKLK